MAGLHERYDVLLLSFDWGNEVYRRKSGLQGSMNDPADRFIDEFMGEFGLLQCSSSG